MLNWKGVPEQFQYLRNTVLDTRADDLRVWLYDETLGRHVGPGEKMTEAELPELARVYREIFRREDNLAILDWLDQAWQTNKKLERDAAGYIGGLLCLFQELAELGIAPFNERTILTEKPEPQLDWSTLPSELAYLGEAVEKYAALQSEMAIIEWLDTAHEEELDELRELAARMSRDKEQIGDWSKKFKGSREAFRVYWLGAIFDHADIELE